MNFLWKLAAPVAVVLAVNASSPALAQEAINSEPWAFSVNEGLNRPVCNLQVRGFTTNGDLGPLLELQWNDGAGVITVTFDNIDGDVMTIYNAAGSAFMRLVLASIDGVEADQAQFVPDFPIVEVFTAAKQIAFAEQDRPTAPYAFINIPQPFNALEDWARCIKTF